MCFDYIFKKCLSDKINLVKKKTKKNVTILITLIVVLGALVAFYGSFSGGSDRVLSHKSDDDKDDKGGNNKNGYQSPSPTFIQPTVSIILSPSVFTVPVVNPTPEPTTEVVVSPTVEPVVTATPTPTEVPEDNNTEQQSQESDKSESNSDQVVVVPVSERSVVLSVSGNSNTSVVMPTKSILKKIENKIKSVGGGSGQFLSRPKTTITPTPTKKEADSGPPVALGPDSSIFYMLTDTDLLLGAVDKENKRINVDEVELRGAEITMDKVLKKKGLDLGVSSDGNLVLTENGVRSHFNLPVFVDVFSHEISVETASGKKQIKTTPVKAVINAIESGYLEDVDKKSQMVMETIKGDELVYKLQGDKKFNLLGRFSVKGVQYVYVDVETGEVREGDQPLLSKFLKLISL